MRTAVLLKKKMLTVLNVMTFSTHSLPYNLTHKRFVIH